MADKQCELCSRYFDELTKHHLIPKSKGGKHVDENIVYFCRQCHSQVHAFFSEKILAKEFNTLQLLKSNAKIIKYVEWARKQNRPKIKTKRSW